MKDAAHAEQMKKRIEILLAMFVVTMSNEEPLAAFNKARAFMHCAREQGYDVVALFGEV